ncbi:MAG: Cobyrinic acid ac-diamide synthase [Gaiellaceae bacterium]|nr:Cobyrinic acid ac-diamide synthase [Gaiellaceae bacterium]
MALSRLLPRLQPRPEPLAEPVEEPPAAPVEDSPRLQAVPEPAPAPEAEGALMANVIVLANQKGGVAKTTTTLNLGVALRELGHRVLVIDLDPQGNLTMSQGMNPDAIDRSMFDVLVHRVPISDVIQTVEVDVAVASIDLAGAELALSALIGRERALEKALVEVRDRYDYILIDTPPSLGLLTINAFVAADAVIVPVQCEYLSLRGLVQLENTLAMVRENLNPRVHVQGIVPTMYDGRTLHAREAIEILEEHFGDLVYDTRIRKTVRYAEAPVKGSSVLKYEPSGPAAQAYRDLAKEVARPRPRSARRARPNRLRRLPRRTRAPRPHSTRPSSTSPTSRRKRSPSPSPRPFPLYIRWSSRTRTSRPRPPRRAPPPATSRRCSSRRRDSTACRRPRAPRTSPRSVSSASAAPG